MLDPIFDKDRPVYVIGGGASLKDFDWQRLAGEQVMAVNLAFFKLPHATALFFGDDAFYDRWRDLHYPAGDFRRFKGEHIFTTAPGLADIAHPRIRYVAPDALTLKKGKKSFSAEQCNSGIKAAVLARLLGAQTVVHLGFDASQGHWADGEPYRHPVGTYDANTFARFNADTAALLAFPGFSDDPAYLT